MRKIGYQYTRVEKHRPKFLEGVKNGDTVQPYLALCALI